jgi:flagellar assembly protein FliH
MSTETSAIGPSTSSSGHEGTLSASSTRQVEPVPSVQPNQVQALTREQLERLESELRQQYRQEYENALQEARVQLEQEAYAHGFSKGEEDARRTVAEQTDQHCRQQIERLLDLIRSVDEAKRNAIDAQEDLLVEIVFAAVCRIMGDAATTREGILGIVREAASHCSDRDRLMVRLNPQDWELMQQSADDRQALELDGRIVLERDLSIKAGGCVIESEAGTLDARLDTQLESMRNALLTARRAAEGMEGPI